MRRLRSVETESTPSRGFPRWAWWVVFLAIFMFAVPLASPWWSQILRSEVPDSPDEESDTGGGPSSGAAGDAAPESSTLKIILHTRTPNAPGLSSVERTIPYVRGVSQQIQAAVAELGVASDGVEPLLPQGARVLDVAFGKSGIVYVDFSPEFELGRNIGAEEERLLILGVVETITENFAAVRRVVILVDGKAPGMGHLDLSRPLRRDDPSFGEDADPASAESSPSPLPSADASPQKAAPPATPSATATTPTPKP